MMRRRGRRRGGRSQWTMALVPLIVPLLGFMESENRKRGVAKIVHTHWQGSGMKFDIPSKNLNFIKCFFYWASFRLSPITMKGFKIFEKAVATSFLKMLTLRRSQLLELLAEHLLSNFHCHVVFHRILSFQNF